MDLKIGDIVEHAILGKIKVIVGIEHNKYLCVDDNDLTSDGKVKENSRVSTHSGNNFYVIGNIPNVQPINSEHLFAKKKITTDLKPSNHIQFILVIVLAFVFGLIILATLTSFILNVRKGAEDLLVKHSQIIKEQIKSEIKIKVIKDKK